MLCCACVCASNCGCAESNICAFVERSTLSLQRSVAWFDAFDAQDDPWYALMEKTASLGSMVPNTTCESSESKARVGD